MAFHKVWGLRVKHSETVQWVDHYGIALWLKGYGTAQ